jgi:hypothetical protein
MKCTVKAFDVDFTTNMIMNNCTNQQQRYWIHKIRHSDQEPKKQIRNNLRQATILYTSLDLDPGSDANCFTL